MTDRGLAGAVAVSPSRVALVAGTPRTLTGARATLIRELVARGVSVLCVAPYFSSEQSAQLLMLGAEHATFPLQHKGPAFWSDWKIQAALADIFRSAAPDVVIGMSERVMALSLMAAHRARVGRRIALFNGFVPRGGFGLEVDDDPLRASPRLLARALKVVDAAVFHNRDDVRRVRDEIGLPADLPVMLLPGAGVDLSAFKPAPLPSAAQGLVFVMLTTLDAAHGVLDYCEAARRLKERAPRAEFLLAGPAGDSATALGAELLRPYSGAVTFLGALADVRSVLERAHVLVYPSHGEGMPRSVQEALAVGRAVITTQSAGCRETVDDCVNGMLVPPGNVAALEDAMARLLMRPDQLASMARASRMKAERSFDERSVIARWLDIIGVPATIDTHQSLRMA